MAEDTGRGTRSHEEMARALWEATMAYHDAAKALEGAKAQVTRLVEEAWPPGGQSNAPYAVERARMIQGPEGQTFAFIPDHVGGYLPIEIDRQYSYKGGAGHEG